MHLSLILLGFLKLAWFDFYDPHLAPPVEMHSPSSRSVPDTVEFWKERGMYERNNSQNERSHDGHGNSQGECSSGRGE